MKIGLSGSGVIALAGVVVVVGALGYLLVKFGPRLKTLVTKTLNPASTDNVINQGVSAAVSAAVGRDESLGGVVADRVFAWRHPRFVMTGPVQEAEARPVVPSGSYTGEGMAGARTKTADGDLATGYTGP